MSVVFGVVIVLVMLWRVCGLAICAVSGLLVCLFVFVSVFVLCCCCVCVPDSVSVLSGVCSSPGCAVCASCKGSGCWRVVVGADNVPVL